MVTFSVIVVCDVIVFIEWLNSFIFKGTLEMYHSELKPVTLNKHAKIWPARQLKTQNSNLRRNEEFTLKGLNFCCCNSRFSLNMIFLNEEHMYLLPCLMITLLKAKVVMWCTKYELLFFNV